MKELIPLISAVVNEKLLGKEGVEILTKRFPTVDFITDETQGESADVALVIPQYFLRHPLEKHPHLKFIQLLMVGLDRFDLAKANRQNIIVSNAQDVYSSTIAEDILTKILVLNRHVRHYVQAMEQGSWAPIRGEEELTGKTVGVLGTGSIGRELAKKIKGFDTRLIGYRRQAGSVPGFSEIFHGEEGLRRVIQDSDVLIVALPLSQETRQLLNKERLALMKPSALFINVSRGEVVDQEALIDCLRNHEIRGAALDVTTPEPLPKDHELWRMEHVYITPHNAVSSSLMALRLATLAGDNLERFLKHEPVRHQVN